MDRRRPLGGSPPIVLRLRSCVSRILFLTRDELARRATISLGSALLRTSSDLPAGTWSRRNQRSPHIWSCCRWGLPCHACHHARGALLPHHFTLTRQRRAVSFCCTFRRVAPPGRYPAPCPAQFGLSSSLGSKPAGRGRRCCRNDFTIIPCSGREVRTDTTA